MIKLLPDERIGRTGLFHFDWALDIGEPTPVIISTLPEYYLKKIKIID